MLYCVVLCLVILCCIVFKKSYFLFTGFYLLEAQVGGKIRYYDATTYNGTNISQYAGRDGYATRR